MIFNLGDTFIEIERYTITHSLSGSLTVDKNVASPGEIVTVTMLADWMNGSLYMTYGNTTTLIQQNPYEGQVITFTMPSSDIELIRSFP